MATPQDATTAVFLSYRRGPGASEAAGRLHDRLQARYGAAAVFMDVDAVRPGMDFVDAIQEAVDSSSALIAIVDPKWAVDASGLNRIQEANDYVRLEIGTALERGVRVIPVLVQGAEMPAADLLPPDLESLARRQAIVLSHERFTTDVLPLEVELDELLTTQPAHIAERQAPRQIATPPAITAVPEGEVPSKTPSRPWTVRVVIAIAALAAIAVAVFAIDGDAESPTEGGAILIERIDREGDIVFVTVKNYGDSAGSTIVACDVIMPDGARPPFEIHFSDVPAGASDTSGGDVPPESDVRDCWKTP